MRKVVFVTIVSTDAAERSFFEAGLIDEVGFNIQPVLLGSGIRSALASDGSLRLHITGPRVELACLSYRPCSMIGRGAHSREAGGTSDILGDRLPRRRHCPAGVC